MKSGLLAKMANQGTAIFVSSAGNVYNLFLNIGDRRCANILFRRPLLTIDLPNSPPPPPVWHSANSRRRIVSQCQCSQIPPRSDFGPRLGFCTRLPSSGRCTRCAYCLVARLFHAGFIRCVYGSGIRRHTYNSPQFEQRILFLNDQSM